MPRAAATKDEVLDRLLETFRSSGYDGASLATLSETTGLMKSSLYHHFPGGKQEMAEQVLAHLDRRLTAQLYTPLRAPLSPARKVAAMLDALDKFYEGGRKACLLERLSASVEAAAFKRPLKKAFMAWIDAVEEVCIEAGLPAAVARERAEDMVVRIEGALLVCAATGHLRVFARTLDDLRSSLIAPVR